MTTDYTSAADDMLGVVNTANNNQTVFGYMPTIRFQGDEEKAAPPSDQVWVRVAINTLVGEQKALAACVQKSGQRIYSSAGLIKIEIHIPRKGSDWRKAGMLAEHYQTAFNKRKTQNGVWFRNVVIRELDPEAEFMRINVAAEFYYSKIN